MTTPTNEAGHGLPELPEWSKRDDLGGLVPSQIRSELRAYARDALALSRGVPADMVPRALVRDLIVGAYNAGTQGVGFTQQLMELPDAPAAAGAQGDEGCGACGNGCKDRAGCELAEQSPPIPQPAAADGGVRERATVADLVVSLRDRAKWGRGGLFTSSQDSEGTSRLLDMAADALAALSSHRQAVDDLSKFRELAERWRDGLKDEDEITAMAHGKFADELLALVEKGAGNG